MVSISLRLPQIREWLTVRALALSQADSRQQAIFNYKTTQWPMRMLTVRAQLSLCPSNNMVYLSPLGFISVDDSMSIRRCRGFTWTFVCLAYRCPSTSPASTKTSLLTACLRLRKPRHRCAQPFVPHAAAPLGISRYPQLLSTSPCIGYATLHEISIASNKHRLHCTHP